MSEPVMALGGARSAGFAAVSELPVRGMIALRAELGAPAVAEALAALGLPIPARRRIEERGARAVAWMSPDELLLMMPQEAVPGVLQTLEQRLGEAHHLAADVSDMRALFRIEGAGAREVLAKLCPVDL